MAKKLNRREFLRLTTLGAAGVAVVACQPTPQVIEKVVTQIVKETVKETVIVEGTPQVVEKEVTTVVEKEVTREVERAEEQVLRIMSGSSGSADFEFNCLVAGSDLQSWIPFFYVPPLYFDVDLNLKPGTFESWESNEDKTVWQFHLNNQAVFSDGSPITAADVKGTWEIQINPVNDISRIRGYLGNVVGFAEARDTGDRADVSGIKVLDEHTVEVTLVNPDPVFHWRIATCRRSRSSSTTSTTGTPTGCRRTTHPSAAPLCSLPLTPTSRPPPLPATPTGGWLRGPTSTAWCSPLSLTRRLEGP
jgi:ABC-type transport system substrate-binding protein